MRNQRYLDAMGIQSWQLKSNDSKAVIVTDDVKSAKQSKLVQEVIKLLGFEVEQCQFKNKFSSTDQVIWDFRLVNRPHKAGILYSSPLQTLKQQVEAKRELWKNICQLYPRYTQVE